MSGFYRPKAPLLGGPLAYFGDDKTKWADRAVAANLKTPHPPLLLSVAELDPAAIADQTLDLAMSLNQRDGRAPRLLWFEGHNHVSTVHGLGLGSDTVGRALRNFATRATE
jgi:triacylglycerol lipase